MHSSRITVAHRTDARPGDALEFALEALPSARLRARLDVPGGNPAGVRVLLRTDDTVPATTVDAVTGARGEIELAPLPAGHYVLELESGSRIELDLAAGEELDLGLLAAER